MIDRFHIALRFGLLLLLGCSTGGQRAEQMGCSVHKNPRTLQICVALADEMEFKLMGHAILAPGYKVTSRSVARVYCRLGLTKDDEEAIRQLRVGNGASDDLLELVGVRFPVGNTVFNPQTPNYILKDGCPLR